jgi:hypothetical protein
MVPQTLHTVLLNPTEGNSTNIQIGAVLGAWHTSGKFVVNNSNNKNNSNNNNNKCQQEDRCAIKFLGTADSQ